ncbi:hypothetical protein NSTC745_04916 [Nostoc sp. DSM 114161]|jgi:putative hemolysin
MQGQLRQLRQLRQFNKKLRFSKDSLKIRDLQQGDPRLLQEIGDLNPALDILFRHFDKVLLCPLLNYEFD